MSRRGRGRRRQAWILALIVVDVALGSVLYSSTDSGPVVLALVVALVLAVFHSSRRRSSRRHR